MITGRNLIMGLGTVSMRMERPNALVLLEMNSGDKRVGEKMDSKTPCQAKGVLVVPGNSVEEVIVNAEKIISYLTCLRDNFDYLPSERKFVEIAGYNFDFTRAQVSSVNAIISWFEQVVQANKPYVRNEERQMEDKLAFIEKALAPLGVVVVQRQH